MAYQTPISRYERDALAKAADTAIASALRGGFAPATAPLGYAFRVDDTTYAVPSGWDDDDYVSDTRIEIEAFIITKVTENGFRIRIGGWDHAPQTRWIDNRWTKQFASRTPEGALRDYAARKRKQERIYVARANTARTMADWAERLLEKSDAPRALV